jgi:hypothetical protein
MKTALGLMIKGENAFIKRVIETDSLEEYEYLELSPIDFMINYQEPIQRQS